MDSPSTTPAAEHLGEHASVAPVDAQRLLDDAGGYAEAAAALQRALLWRAWRSSPERDSEARA
jgi:hypothetical protein